MKTSKLILITIVVGYMLSCFVSCVDDHNNASAQTAAPAAPDTISRIQNDLAPLTLVIKTDSFKVYEFGYGTNKIHCESGYILVDKNGKPISIAVH